MVDIQDVRELTIELNKANFVNKKPLSEEQKNWGVKYQMFLYLFLLK